MSYGIKKKNLFQDSSDQLGLSKMGYQFIGGIMKSVDSFAAWLNPCLNSYERLNAKTTNSGSTYSPTAVTYSGNNRTHMIRIQMKDDLNLELQMVLLTLTCFNQEL